MFQFFFLLLLLIIRFFIHYFIVSFSGFFNKTHVFFFCVFFDFRTFKLICSIVVSIVAVFNFNLFLNFLQMGRSLETVGYSGNFIVASALIIFFAAFELHLLGACEFFKGFRIHTDSRVLEVLLRRSVNFRLKLLFILYSFF